jgi:hypothetical protein
MNYASGKRQQQPVGSGAIESTCRQYQVRFKRSGQFWSLAGDEALLAWKPFVATSVGRCCFPTQTASPSRQPNA